MPAELRTLMERYCQLGRLLPPVDLVGEGNPRVLAEAEVVLKEMTQVKAEIDAFLAMGKG